MAVVKSSGVTALRNLHWEAVPSSLFVLQIRAKATGRGLLAGMNYSIAHTRHLILVHFAYHCTLSLHLFIFIYFALRTASPERSANFSSPTGPSKECPKLEKASSISLDKCTKPRNSLGRMDQSLYTAGNDHQWLTEIVKQFRGEMYRL